MPLMPLVTLHRQTPASALIAGSAHDNWQPVVSTSNWRQADSSELTGKAGFQLYGHGKLPQPTIA